MKNYTKFLDQFSSNSNVYIYEGEYLNGLKNGMGILKRKGNGEVFFNGSFKNDEYNGNGVLILNNGYIYEGNFLKQKRQGLGRLYSNDKKFIYEGEWVDDQKEGFGKEMFPDGTRFEGQFQKGKKNGKGIYY